MRVADTGTAVPLGAYAQIHRSPVPSQIQRNGIQRAAWVLMQTEGRDIGSAAERAGATVPRDPRRHDSLHGSWADRAHADDLLGLGLAIGLAIMVVFMIMASQFKSVCACPS